MAAPVVTIQKNGQTVRSLTLDSGEAVLGRGEGCVIRLEDRAVSRQHAVLKSGPGGLRIERKSHLAPLFVNGAECEAAVLKEGDEIFIGPYVLRIAIPQEQARIKEAGLEASESAPERVTDGTSLISPAESDHPQEISDGLLPELEGPDLNSLGGDLDEFKPQLVEAEIPVLESESLAPPVTSAPSVEEAPELSSMIEEDAKTRVFSGGSVVKLKLRFSPGAANLEIQEFDQDEISIGRGKGCDVVLNDRKASRKHLVIRRSGSGVETTFTIRDLESANGIYVNGARVAEHVLSGDDVIRVGDTEFTAQAVLPNYDKQAENFLKLEHEMPIHEESRILAGMAEAADALQGAVSASPMISGAAASKEAFSSVMGVSGIPGASGSAGKMNLLERYRAMPQRSRMIWIAFIGMLVYTLMEELPGSNPPPQKKTAATEKVAAKKKGPADGTPGESTLPTFDQLKPELQKFVDSQYNLALEYFRNRDYDRSLYEVRKIFQYVSDYRDARDLERYSVESKQRVQAQEDERRRKEAEQAAKARVARLIIEVEGHMARKEYVQARELFAEIVAIEPDNAQIAGWKKEIEAYEEARDRERLVKKLEQETLQKARDLVASGQSALKQRRWSAAVESFKSVYALEIRDRRVLGQASAGIARAKAGVAAEREPLIEEAKRLEQESSYGEAFKKFSEARRIDPYSAEAKLGMERVRGVLRDKSKQLYTEAVLAESYSDFSLAKSRFEQLVQIAPPDDPYYERARRKLSRYLVKEESPR